MLHNTIEQDARSYRTPMNIHEKQVIANCSFAVCPRCKITLEREYQNYCDRCGQALKWQGYSQIRNKHT